MGLFEFWRQYISNLGALTWPIYQVTQKAASFKWSLEQEKALKQVQAARQAVLQHNPYDPADSMMFETLATDGDAVWRI